MGEWFDKRYSRIAGYYARNVVFTTLMVLLMIPLSIIFDNWYMAIIGTIIINILRGYTYGYHCKVLEKCIILTNSLFLIFGYIAKQSIGYLWIVFLLSLWCFRDIYIRAPIGKTKYKDKNRVWHKSQIGILGVILFTISFIMVYLNFNLIASNILYAIVMVDLLLFIRED